MKNIFVVFILALGGPGLLAQPSLDASGEMFLIKKTEHTPIKDQANTGTCWSFSTTSLVESQVIHSGLGELDLSEMFTVRNIYIEKARNYILRQGAAQFSPGGLGHDVINSIKKYGAMPEASYSGLLLGKKSHDHDQLDLKLKAYLDDQLKTKPLSTDWLNGFQAILDDHLGKVPETFRYREKVYTPVSFALEVLQFSAEDYVLITSFNHHPFYSSFVLEVPDNYSNGVYCNVPLEEMIALTQRALEKGYSVVWDGDVSNLNFKQRNGFALQLKNPKSVSAPVDPDIAEESYNQKIRQQLFENLTTQDDHLMHIIGLEKTKNGKKFFLVKDSYGENKPFKGYIKISEAYFAINTISIIVPKASLTGDLKAKLGL